MNYFFAVVVAQLPSCREKREELSNSRAFFDLPLIFIVIPVLYRKNNNKIKQINK